MSDQEYVIRKSTRSDKKYMLVTPDNKKVHFGARGMDDFTITGDEEQKRRYLGRHQKKESNRWVMNRENLIYPSFLSRFVLWNKPTLVASVHYISEALGVRIVLDV